MRFTPSDMAFRFLRAAWFNTDVYRRQDAMFDWSDGSATSPPVPSNALLNAFVMPPPASSTTLFAVDTSQYGVPGYASVGWAALVAPIM
ncbi:hypothetical protein BLIC_b01293 [Bifidobacterium longum subsp. infantis]|uniref:Uncharacterized protein n=1 Tax=Bifidobacterium longum subsp. infantis TaxID=1682 RepID=A0ABM9R4P2_BIFLI|nr:hypothetical protein BLIC_a01291 [Bifidobacterium longum subsp. infantis]CEF00357.1 hypothetical protein BLIC_b01293 [Bifidobacterium longum subsp. infantis]CEF01471.1 hypothetical protein BLIC_c01297 [Bifidobacterium longum subsp. infantis]